MNIRMPKELSSEIMKVQDEYLTERAAEKGVVNLSDIPVIRDGLSIWQGDITRLSVDSIRFQVKKSVGPGGQDIFILTDI